MARTDLHFHHAPGDVDDGVNLHVALQTSLPGEQWINRLDALEQPRWAEVAAHPNRFLRSERWRWGNGPEYPADHPAQLPARQTPSYTANHTGGIQVGSDYANRQPGRAMTRVTPRRARSHSAGETTTSGWSLGRSQRWKQR